MLFNTFLHKYLQEQAVTEPLKMLLLTGGGNLLALFDITIILIIIVK